MVQTIAEIQSNYGLPQDDKTKKPFEDLETSVLDNLSKFLDDRESARQETAQAQGFGRSTFHEQAARQEEADVISKIGTTFSQARLSEAQAETAFSRDITKTGVIADIQETQAIANQQRNLETLDAQADANIRTFREQTQIEQEKNKTFTQLYADRALTEQMGFLDTERTDALSSLDASYKNDELTDEEYSTQKQNIINQNYTKRIDAIKQAQKDGNISTGSALDNEKALIQEKYKAELGLQQDRFKQSMITQYGDNVFSGTDEEGNPILNPEFKGELAEKAYYSQLLEQDKLKTTYDIEVMRAESANRVEIMKNLIANMTNWSEADKALGNLFIKSINSVADKYTPNTSTTNPTGYK